MVVICIDLRQIFHAPFSTDFNFFRVLCAYFWTELVEPKCAVGVNGNASSSSSIFKIKFLATAAAAAAVSSCFLLLARNYFSSNNCCRIIFPIFLGVGWSWKVLREAQ
jgi:hypothetical protein